VTASVRWRSAVAAIAAGWGSVAVVVQAVDLPAAAIAFYRVAIAGLAIGVVLLVAGRVRTLAVPARDLRRVLLLGAVLGVHWLAFFQTIKLSSVALGVLLVYTGPLITAALAPRLLGAPTSRLSWAPRSRPARPASCSSPPRAGEAWTCDRPRSRPGSSPAPRSAS
jgi:drug/metabolite transporter (DMT)-like permease